MRLEFFLEWFWSPGQCAHHSQSTWLQPKLRTADITASIYLAAIAAESTTAATAAVTWYYNPTVT